MVVGHLMVVGPGAEAQVCPPVKAALHSQHFLLLPAVLYIASRLQCSIWASPIQSMCNPDLVILDVCNWIKVIQSDVALNRLSGVHCGSHMLAFRAGLLLRSTAMVFVFRAFSFRWFTVDRDAVSAFSEVLGTMTAL